MNAPARQYCRPTTPGLSLENRSAAGLIAFLIITARLLEDVAPWLEAGGEGEPPLDLIDGWFQYATTQYGSGCSLTADTEDLAKRLGLRLQVQTISQGAQA